MKSTSKSMQEPAHSTIVSEEMIRYYDTATKEKISKHLNDINDTITEEDIRNIDTNVTLIMLNSHPQA
ncbi:MAG: hypothetical protein QM687_10590 [Ferruginibacter sp.]